MDKVQPRRQKTGRSLQPTNQPLGRAINRTNDECHTTTFLTLATKQRLPQVAKPCCCCCVNLHASSVHRNPEKNHSQEGRRDETGKRFISVASRSQDIQSLRTKRGAPTCQQERHRTAQHRKRRLQKRNSTEHKVMPSGTGQKATHANALARGVVSQTPMDSAAARDCRGA